MTHARFLILMLMSIGLGSPGCTSVVSEVAQKAWEDRSTADQAADLEISSGIVRRLSDRDAGLLLDVSTDVWERRVLLTGALDSLAEKTAVERLVKNDRRIRRVYSHIRIVSTADKEKRRAQAQSKDDSDKSGGVGQTVNDFWIETKIKTQLLAAKGVTSVNYRWRSVLNDAYIIGRAGSAAEKNKVLTLIRQTNGVRSVRDYIEVKPPRT
jgi:hyperosmotically inducible protein